MLSVCHNIFFPILVLPPNFVPLTWNLLAFFWDGGSNCLMSDVYTLKHVNYRIYNSFGSVNWRLIFVMRVQSPHLCRRIALVKVQRFWLELWYQSSINIFGEDFIIFKAYWTLMNRKIKLARVKEKKSRYSSKSQNYFRISTRASVMWLTLSLLLYYY